MKFLLNRRHLVLTILLVGTVLAAVWASDKDHSKIGPAAAPVDAGREIETTTVIDLERLKRPAARTQVVNLFASKTWFVPPPVRPRSPRPPPPPPPPPPRAPPVPFTYLGRMQEATEPFVIFLVKGDRVHIVKVGDVIDATYRVEEISGSRLTLTYLPLNIRQTLPVGGDS